jgi:hypothetical protein
MENKVDEIQVQLEEAQNDAVEETVSLDEAESTEVNSGDSDDELDRYTRGVSKRINKLTAKYKAAEDRAVQAETRYAQMQNELNALRKKQAVLDESYTSEYENRVKSQKEQAEELYRKAKETNDPDLEVKSVELLNKVALEEERVRLAKVQSEQNKVAQETQQNVVQAPQQVYDEPKPDAKAVAWAEKNSWFQKDRVKTYTAMGIHEDLTNEGYDGTEDEYYEEISIAFKGNVVVVAPVDKSNSIPEIPVVVLPELVSTMSKLPNRSATGKVSSDCTSNTTLGSSMIKAIISEALVLAG